jgi:hypothetical protein
MRFVIMGQSDTDLNWTASTLLYGVVGSIAGLILLLGIERATGIPDAGLERYLAGGLLGALTVVAKHRRRPFLTILVFMPVMSFLLLAAALLFHVYVLGNPIEL